MIAAMFYFCLFDYFGRYPCFQCPYALDVHESPVTCLKYYSDCASDLIPAFYSCGSKQKRKGFSDKVCINYKPLSNSLCHYLI